MSDQIQIDRRQFAGGLVAATGGIAALVMPLHSTADDKPPTEKPQAAPNEAEKAKGPPERVAPPSQEALLLTVLTQRYPSDHYDETSLRGIFGDLRGDLVRGRILSEFPLKNADAPSHDFRAYRGKE